MSIDVTYSADGRVATWWIDRARVRNAVNLEMWQALSAACDEARQRDELRVVVLRGRGDHFSAGADIASLGRSLAADVDGSNYRATNARAEADIASLPIPTIAAVDGFCVGGGVQIALACDLRVATSSAQFGVTPARLGIAYPAGALQRLVATVGLGSASELLLLGDMITASRAQQIGLVQYVVDDLEQAVSDLTTTLLSRSRFTHSAVKEVLNALVDAVDVAPLGQALERASLEHPDLTEGLTAFAEKRAPQF